MKSFLIFCAIYCLFAPVFGADSLAPHFPDSLRRSCSAKPMLDTCRYWFNSWTEPVPVAIFRHDTLYIFKSRVKVMVVK